MSNPYKYDGLLVDPDLNSRMRLKQATSAVPAFGTVTQVGTTNEALSRLQNLDRCDVIFVSYRFDQSEINSFIQQAKALKGGQDAAYVLVLQTAKGDSATIAQSVLGGADGMLFEPYSVEFLYEITNLAAKVKKERSSAREKAAISVIVNDLTNQVDQAAYLKSCNMDTSRVLKKIREACTFLAGLSPETMQTYYELAVKTFENARIPTQISKYKKYGGVSDRIKKRMEKKVAAELDAKEPSSKDPPKE